MLKRRKQPMPALIKVIVKQAKPQCLNLIHPVNAPQLTDLVSPHHTLVLRRLRPHKPPAWPARHQVLVH